LGKNSILVARMFIDDGDPNLRLNLPSRPALSALASFCFILGLGIATVRFRLPRYQLLLLWLLIMLIPTLLSRAAPSSLRAIGAIPSILILVALGLSTLQQRLLSRIRLSQTMKFLGVLTLFTLVTGSITFRDYFHRWANMPDLAVRYDTRELALAQRALSELSTVDIAVPAQLYSHPTFVFYIEPEFSRIVPLESWAANRPVSLLRKLNQPFHSIVLLHRNNAGAGVFSLMRPLAEETSAAILEQNTLKEVYYDSVFPIGEEIEQIGSFLPRQAKPQFGISSNSETRISLIGYDLSPVTLEAGQGVSLVLYWQSMAPVRTYYESFAHLVTSTHEIVSGQHQQPLWGYPTSIWQPGDVILDAYGFTVPADAIPGKYQFDVGLFNLVSGERLNIMDNGQVADNHVLVGAMTVIDTDISPSSPSVLSDITFGDKGQIRLIGYDLDGAELTPGEAIDLTLHWQGLAIISIDYTVFIHIIDAAGELATQQDTMPGDGRYRTSLWFVDETIRDQHHIVLPSELPSGEYRIALGLYYWATGERLPSLNRDGESILDFRPILPSTITVRE
jgi:hypothetical protein